MGQDDDDLRLGHVKRVALRLQQGTRVYVEGKCGPTVPYGLAFVVEEVTKDSVDIEYGGWVGESYYRPQQVRVPRYHKPTRLSFKSTFDLKASDRPLLAIALLDGEPVQLLVGTVPSH